MADGHVISSMMCCLFIYSEGGCLTAVSHGRRDHDSGWGADRRSWSISGGRFSGIILEQGDLGMDANDPAVKLARAADASRIGDDPDQLDKTIQELKPSSATIARAYALCLNQNQPFTSEANRLMLNTRLQVALMEEHVAAQRRMGFTINALTWVLVVLTLVLVIFGVIDLGQKLNAG